MRRIVRGIAASVLLLPAACGPSSNGTCTPRVPTDGTAPNTLAEWCQVELSGGEVKALATDVVPFAPNTPLYSDGAIKRRTVRLPPGNAATYDDTDALGFPDGTVFTKSFGFRDYARDDSLPIHWIETLLEWRAGGWRYA